MDEIDAELKARREKFVAHYERFTAEGDRRRDLEHRSLFSPGRRYVRDLLAF